MPQIFIDLDCSDEHASAIADAIEAMLGLQTENFSLQLEGL